MANDDEDSQRRWEPRSAAADHSREVQTRSLEDMHYQQLNDNFPPFLAQPFGLQYKDWKKKFLPPVSCEGLLYAVVHDTGSFPLCGMTHSPHARRVQVGKNGSVRKDAR